MFNFFDHIQCLTQKERKDRQFDFERECAKYGIIGTYYYAEPSDLEDGARFDSFCRSQIGMLKRFLEGNGNNFLALEDDVSFNGINNLSKAVYQLPMDWDLLYLGANIIGTDTFRFPQPEQIGDHLFKIYGAWTTHAVGYTRKSAELIVENYHSWKESGMYDDWLSRVFIPNHKCYIVYPMVAVQRPVKSDLWNKHVDYTGCFEQGNRLMYEISLQNEQMKLMEVKQW